MYANPSCLLDMDKDSTRRFVIHASDTVCNLIAIGVSRRLQQFILSVAVSCACVCVPENAHHEVQRVPHSTEGLCPEEHFLGSPQRVCDAPQL